MNADEVVFADDFSVAGNLNSIKDYWDKLTATGPKYGYFPKPIIYLIVKEKNWWNHKTFLLIQEWNHSWRKTHLGAINGNTEYCEQYVKDLVKDWDNQLTILSTIAETQLEAAYLAFATGFKSKLNYFLRSIPNIRHLLLPLERTIWNKFIPAVTGYHWWNDEERVQILLPTRYGPNRHWIWRGYYVDTSKSKFRQISTLFPRTFFDVISLVKISTAFLLTFFNLILMVKKSTLFARTFFDEISMSWAKNLGLHFC